MKKKLILFFFLLLNCDFMQISNLNSMDVDVFADSLSDDSDSFTKENSIDSADSGFSQLQDSTSFDPSDESFNSEDYRFKSKNQEDDNEGKVFKINNKKVDDFKSKFENNKKAFASKYDIYSKKAVTVEAETSVDDSNQRLEDSNQTTEEINKKASPADIEAAKNNLKEAKKQMRIKSKSIEFAKDLKNSLHDTKDINDMKAKATKSIDSQIQYLKKEYLKEDVRVDAEGNSIQNLSKDSEEQIDGSTKKLTNNSEISQKEINNTGVEYEIKKLEDLKKEISKAETTDEINGKINEYDKLANKEYNDYKENEYAKAKKAYDALNLGKIDKIKIEADDIYSRFKETNFKKLGIKAAKGSLEVTKEVGHLLMEQGKMFFLMTLPQILQTSVLQSISNAVLLAEITGDIEIAGLILQIPSIFINKNDPESSVFLYVLIGVKDIDEKMPVYKIIPGTKKYLQINGKKVKNLFHGPSEYTFGKALGVVSPIKRYELSPQYLTNSDTQYFANCPTSNSYYNIATVALNYAMSQGSYNNPINVFCISKNFKFFYNGQPVDSGFQISALYEILNYLYPQVENLKYQVSFQQGELSDNDEAAVKASIISLFDCISCKNSNIPCNKACVFYKYINEILSGYNLSSYELVQNENKSKHTNLNRVDVDINKTSRAKRIVSNYTPKSIFPITNNKDSKIIGKFSDSAEATKKYIDLGVVQPLNGIPDFTPIQDFFKQYDEFNDMQGMIKTYKKGVEVIKGATYKPYILEGLYIYKCYNKTPFIEKMKQLTAIEIDNNSPICDFVVFLDSDFNIVPFLSEDIIEKTDYNRVGLKINPQVRYYASLLSYNLPEFSSENGVSLAYDIFTNEPVEMNLIYSNIQALLQNFNKNFPILNNQFETHSALILNLYNYGPYGKNGIMAAKDIQNNAFLMLNTVNIYTKLQCFPVFMADTPLYDLLFFQDKISKKLLNFNEVFNYKKEDILIYGLVTDIEYCFNASFEIVPADFSKSPINFIANRLEVTANAQQLNNFYYYQEVQSLINEVASNTQSSQAAPTANFFSKVLGKFSASTTVSPSTIVLQYIQTIRADWLSILKKNNYIGLTAAEILSSNETNSNNFTLFAIIYNKVLGGSNLYIYKKGNELFYLFNFASDSNSVGVQAINYNLVKDISYKNSIPLSNINENTIAISLTSGKVEYLNGNIVFTADKKPFVLDQKNLFASIADSYKINAVFNKEANALVDIYAKSYNTLIKKWFYNMPLYTLKGEENSGNYLYFQYDGNPTEPFDPAYITDVLITYANGNLDAAQAAQFLINVNNSTFIYSKLNDQVDYVFSLINGKVYSQSGEISVVLGKETIDYVFSIIKSIYSDAIVNQISVLQKDYAKQQVAVEYFNDAEFDVKNLELSTYDAEEIIKKLISLPYLSTPYQLIKQLDNKYYVFIQDKTTQAISVIFFGVLFNEKNNKDTKKYVSVMYSYENGKVTSVNVFKDEENLMMESNYGVYVLLNGTQELGLPDVQPKLLLTEKDINLKPGTAGQYMQPFGSNNCPIKSFSPVLKTENCDYYFYYNTKTKTYYLMANNKKTNFRYYINLDILNSNDYPYVYSLDGSDLYKTYDVFTKNTKATSFGQYFIPIDSQYNIIMNEANKYVSSSNLIFNSSNNEKTANKLACNNYYFNLSLSSNNNYCIQKSFNNPKLSTAVCASMLVPDKYILSKYSASIEATPTSNQLTDITTYEKSKNLSSIAATLLFNFKYDPELHSYSKMATLSAQFGNIYLMLSNNKLIAAFVDEKLYVVQSFAKETGYLLAAAENKSDTIEIDMSYTYNNSLTTCISLKTATGFYLYLSKIAPKITALNLKMLLKNNGIKFMMTAAGFGFYTKYLDLKKLSKVSNSNFKGAYKDAVYFDSNSNRYLIKLNPVDAKSNLAQYLDLHNGILYNRLLSNPSSEDLKFEENGAPISVLPRYKLREFLNELEVFIFYKKQDSRYLPFVMLQNEANVKMFNGAQKDIF